MEITQGALDKLQPLNRSLFEKIREIEFRPHYDLQGLKQLRDKAGKERDLRELYRERALYELLQNADDAGAQNTLFILTDDGLVFAHDGRWFNIDNFRNLADGWSNKDPSECIGHKGLGFRSVLDITPAPHLIRIDSSEFFAIKFSWSLNNGHIQESFNKDPTLRLHYNDWTQHGQSACPIMAIPGYARKQSMGKAARIFDELSHNAYGVSLTTMFWFPAEDPDINKDVLRELAPVPIVDDSAGREVLLKFLKEQASVLLPFLASLSRISVFSHTKCFGTVGISEESIKRNRNGEITVDANYGGLITKNSFFQMTKHYSIPPNILNEPDTPKAVQRAMKKAGVTLSVRLNENQPIYDDDAVFHVYFPTEEDTCFGFTIHGDYYLKPDRTRLMAGKYNEWLLGNAAKLAANDFLTGLLERYNPGAVYEALSPSGVNTNSGKIFFQAFGQEIRSRKTPFIPTRMGLLNVHEIVLPPDIDEDGFWDSHFYDDLIKLKPDKKAFLSPAVDGKKSRSFLNLAEVETLRSESLIDFIESTCEKQKSPDWYFECYSHMFLSVTLSRQDSKFYEGKKLVLTDNGLISVPVDQNIVICLPPGDEDVDLSVPACFSDIFVFLHPSLADRLRVVSDTIRNWILDRLHITKFEASDLLPRAIRNVVRYFYSGERPITSADLQELWVFIKDCIDASRTTILSQQFWAEVGRIPLPVKPVSNTDISRDSLVPAFLCYWPDEFLDNESSIFGVPGLRRVDKHFLSSLIGNQQEAAHGWMSVLRNAGLSWSPKTLKYSRLVAKGQDVVIEAGALQRRTPVTFTGDRQADQNRAVLDVISGSGELWKLIVDTSSCAHKSQKVLQSLTLIDGIIPCTLVANEEYMNQDENWRKRLWSLVKSLSSINLRSDDHSTVIHCPAGGTGGHQLTSRTCIEYQLQHYNWLPSSLGPANNLESFSRLSTRHLISPGPGPEPIGDQLFPYIVARDINDIVLLQNLNVDTLDDAGSASPAVLRRALVRLGAILSTDWAKINIIGVKSRWRLVRGAIQEIYRVLNQASESFDWPPDAFLVSRTSNEVELKSPPLYYAQPGSAVERAFFAILPMIDSDRMYSTLFERLKVSRLVPGDTVDETFIGLEKAVPSDHLYEQIVNNLSCFLLALTIIKCDKPGQGELVVRRLQERFSVKIIDKLEVLFALKDTEISSRINFSKFYLQKKIIAGKGAIEEAHYNLYVVGDPGATFASLDADAMGEALTPIFLDGASDDAAPFFPRIVSRYQAVHGDMSVMGEYLLIQFGISKEAQEAAYALLSGEMSVDETPLIAPPAKILKPISIPASLDTHKVWVPENIISAHKKEMEEKARILISSFTTRCGASSGHGGSGYNAASRRLPISPVQQDRGRRGEEEIKRRLMLPGGWEGFTYAEDKRHDNCGYDFLCSTADGYAKLEIKTFTPDGRVIVTSGELQEAAMSENNYYLIGLLELQKSIQEWPAYIAPAPIGLLLTKGKFTMEARLEALATELFNFNDE